MKIIITPTIRTYELPQEYEIMMYCIIEDKNIIMAGVRGYGSVILWEGDEFGEHIHDSESELLERLVYQILKVN